MPKSSETHSLPLKSPVGADESPERLLRAAAEIKEFQTGLIIQRTVCATVTDPTVYHATTHGKPLPIGHQLKEAGTPQLEHSLVLHERA